MSMYFMNVQSTSYCGKNCSKKTEAELFYKRKSVKNFQ